MGKTSRGKAAPEATGRPGPELVRRHKNRTGGTAARPSQVTEPNIQQVLRVHRRAGLRAPWGATAEPQNTTSFPFPKDSRALFHDL